MFKFKIILKLIRLLLLLVPLILTWRSRRAREAEGGRFTPTVLATSDLRQRQLDRVEFFWFEDTLRYSPPAFIRAQLRWIGLFFFFFIAIFLLGMYGTYPGSRGGDWSLFALFGVLLLVCLIWLNSLSLRARRRYRHYAELAESAARKISKELRSEPVKFNKSGQHFALLAQWTDESGHTWETRSGPYLGDPVNYFRGGWVIILVDAKDPRMSVIEPARLPRLMDARR